ncbi:restriction endonuclease subunit S [Anatilimnocola floriformis]|uniref:restriction endonuclease subunit S n=1 Tax=Anatilimnocola floriformis TaxID=2948575 RepID=UPI0020C4C7B5|nr:restriction endonuclease subunit S [Anatilimnocola floriformis]
MKPNTSLDKWESRPVGDDIELFSGHHVLARHCNTHGVGTPYLTGPADFPDGRIQQTKFTTKPTTICRAGDILVTVKGSGAGTLIVADREYCISRQLMAIRPLTWNAVFLFYSLLQNATQFKAAATGLIPGLSRSDVLNQQLPIPTCSDEQPAIAEALADVDRLIGALEALTRKKRDMKLAAMQQLLTGKIRLPGFIGKWEVMQLGEIGEFSKGRGIKRDDVTDEGVPCVRYGELYTRYRDYVIVPSSRIPNQVAQQSLPIKTGDLLFAGSGETAEEIGRCAAYLGEQTAYAGGDIVVLSPQGHNSLYLGHLMNHPSVARQKARLAQGDAVVHISARNLAQVEVLLPPTNEQDAIAVVLSDMEAEIESLERRSDKAKRIRQGMMQQLLTGRIRLMKRKEQATNAKTAKGHNKQINEAVVISVLAKHFGSEQFPLGRKRYTKLSYLLHRHSEQQVEGYLKMAAGPYNPQTKYGGAEKIALKNSYVREHQSGVHGGFVAGENITQAEAYFEKWYGSAALQWLLTNFRYKKNDDLELLATVDMAAEELRVAGKPIDVSGVKQVIQGNAEWRAKLDRTVFADSNIATAIETCRKLFG